MQQYGMMPSRFGYSGAYGSTAYGETSSAKRTLLANAKIQGQMALGAASGFAAGGPIGAAIGGVSAGVMGLVNAVREAKMNRQEAVALAEEMGIPFASEVPSFIVSAIEWTPEKRASELEEYQRKLGKHNIWDAFQNEKRLGYKIEILASIDALERCAAAGRCNATAPQAALNTLVGWLAPGTQSRQAFYLVAIGLLAAAAVTSIRRRKSRRR